jgi:abortive infection bacteriophage resistance protein
VKTTKIIDPDNQAPEMPDHISSLSTSLLPPKPFQGYAELVNRLKSRGMIIKDEKRAIRKFSQIGYYRLSGYWHPLRQQKFNKLGEQILDKVTNTPKREDKFIEGADFEDIIKLYLFDKNLRLLLLDAIERIEIHIRSVIAHELGSFDPLAYRNPTFIDPGHLKDYERDGEIRNNWKAWCEKNEERINRSRDACITWNKRNYTEIPFWVVIETWDFGLMSTYYNLLGDKYKDMICKRINVPNKKSLNSWLQEINTLRNKCAHHSRIWNTRLSNPLVIKGLTKHDYFKNLEIRPDYPRRRIYGCICILWFLVRQIGPSSTWIEKVAEHIDSLPKSNGIDFHAMGIPGKNGFPREKFDIPPKKLLPRFIYKIKNLLQSGTNWEKK